MFKDADLQNDNIISFDEFVECIQPSSNQTPVIKYDYDEEIKKLEF